MEDIELLLCTNCRGWKPFAQELRELLCNPLSQTGKQPSGHDSGDVKCYEIDMPYIYGVLDTNCIFP